MRETCMSSSNGVGGGRALKVDLCKYKSLTQIGNGASLCVCVCSRVRAYERINCTQGQSWTETFITVFSPQTPLLLRGSAHPFGQ